MFQLKHLLLLGFLSLASGQKSISCSEIMEIFDQTENQYYDLGCSETNEKSSKVLEYQCRVLQKKMDIFGHRYFDFGDWSKWSECKNEKQERTRKSCSGRTDIQKQTCTNSGKVLIAAGFPGKFTEIIDLYNASFVCKGLPNYPKKCFNPEGGLVENQPLICGGYFRGAQKSCFSLTKTGWKQTASLSTSRYLMGRGSIIFKNQLLLHGGGGGHRAPKTSELASPDTVNKSFNLPIALYRHCNIKINESTILITGGQPHGSKQSFFQNLKTGDWIEGPEMLVSRRSHGCAKFKFEGRPIAITAGGKGNIGRSVEWFDLGQPQKGWQKGTGLHFSRHDFPLITSPDGKSVFLVGGKNSGRGRKKGLRGEIFEYVCKTSLSNCIWKRIKTRMRFSRYNHVAFSIPNELAKNMCK